MSDKPTTKEPIRWATALLALAVLMGLVQQVDFAEVQQAFVHMQQEWLVGLLCAYCGVQFFRTARFGSLQADVPFNRVFLITVLHAFYLRVLPLRAGEVSYALLLKRAKLGRVGTGVAHLAMTRLLDILLIGGVTMVCLASFQGDVSGQAEESSHLLSILAGVLLLVGVLALLRLKDLFVLLQRGAGALLGKLRIQHTRMGRIITELLDDSIEACNTMPRAKLYQAVLFSLGMWIFAFLVMWTALQATGVSPTLPQLLLGGAVTIVASFLPIGLIGSFGVLETGWALGFQWAGFTLEQALASALIYSVGTLAAGALFAAPAEALLRLNAKNTPESRAD